MTRCGRNKALVFMGLVWAKLLGVLVSDFDYRLPAKQIAQRALERRDASRMLELSREIGSWVDREFRELPELVRGDELLVFNNARVIPARLFGRRAGVHSQRASRATARE